jgi:uncharacterized protein (TIGR03435 family)
VRSIVLLMMMCAGAAAAQQQRPMAADAKPGFEVVTIKPSDPMSTGGTDIDMEGRHFMLKNYPVRDMIAFAYGLHRDQVLNGPAWIKDRYDVDGTPDVEGEPNVKQMQGMVQKLLEERFTLKSHREQRELAMYAVTVAKGGVKMTVSKPESNLPSFNVNGGAHRRTMNCTGTTMEDFALALQLFFIDKPVVNQTGLAGRYDFKLVWNPDLAGDSEGSDVPSLFTAMPDQLGLKIEAKKGPVRVVVVETMTRPTEN